MQDDKDLTPSEVLDLLLYRYREKLSDVHVRQTEACLSLFQFDPESVEQWTEAEREHVRTCPTGYCQRMLALSWRGEHPPLTHLSQYARGEYPYPKAMQFHLEHDRCRRCQLVVKVLETLRMVAATVAVVYGEGLLRQAEEAAAFAEPRAPVYLHQTSEDGKLIVTVVETDLPEHELKVYVEAPGCGEGGGRVRVTLAGESATLERELELEKTEFGWKAEASFGKFEEAVARLGEDWVVVAVLLEPEG